MKKIKLTIAIIALVLYVNNAFASNYFSYTLPNNEIQDNPNVESIKKLRKKIMTLLGRKVAVVVSGKKNIRANISFLINNKMEVVVVSVASEHDSLVSYIKRKLNGKKIEKIPGIKVDKIYTMPLRIQRT